MNIEYVLILRDEIEGHEIALNYFKDVYEAIEEHTILLQKENLKQLIKTTFQDYAGGIDQYYLNNPHKRFYITLEVDYT